MLNVEGSKACAGDAAAQQVNGCLKELNNEECFYWHMKAALRGDVEAMCNAGLQLLQGVCVERSIEAGLHLIKLAATKCSYKACRLLGDMHMMGLYGLETDRRIGEYWYRQAEKVWDIW